MADNKIIIKGIKLANNEVATFIDDSNINPDNCWSSAKTNQEIQKSKEELQNTTLNNMQVENLRIMGDGSEAVITKEQESIRLTQNQDEDIILRGIAPGQDGNDAISKAQLDAAVDSAVNVAVKDTIDKTCAAFTKTGTMVTCEPVEGYPLEVEWKTKNLATTDILVGANGITENDGVFSGLANDFFQATKNGGLVAGEFEEGQQYTFSVYAKKDLEDSSPYLRIRYTDGTPATNNIITAYNDFERISVVSTPGKTVASVSFDYVIDAGNPTLQIKNVQVEKGVAATTYEPYAETATSITRCGKNIFDYETFCSANGYKKTDDVWVGSPKNTRIFTNNAGISDPITISYMGKSTSGKSLHFTINYADGTRGEIAKIVQSDTLQLITGTTKSNVSSIAWWYNNNGTNYIKNLQIEFGSAKTNYEPYRGDVYEINGSTSTIPAISGTNYIFADKGLVTVTGKENPAAAINNLQTRLAALEAAVVSNA